jgi:hypothetical protein
LLVSPEGPPGPIDGNSILRRRLQHTNNTIQCLADDLWYFMRNFLSQSSTNTIGRSGYNANFSVSNEKELKGSFRYRAIHCLKKRGCLHITYNQFHCFYRLDEAKFP